MATKKTQIPKETKQILIGVIILIVVIYFVKKYREDSEQSEINAGTSSDGTPKTLTSTSSTSSKTTVPAWQKKYNALPTVGKDTLLKKGMKSKEIWTLQYLYNENIAKKEGKSKIGVDGDFGSQTEAAIKYATSNKYAFTKLSIWKNITSMTKAQRIAKFTEASVSDVSSMYNPLGVPLISAESTGVYNPYTF